MADARRDQGRDLGDLSTDFAAKELALEEELEMSIEEAVPDCTDDGDTAAIPPERVRFTAPVGVKVEGQEKVTDGVTLNLSIRGLAFCAPVVMKAGQRVWTHFRLSLADEDLALLCEVIWSTPAGDNDHTYGLRFVSITPEEQVRVRAAVAERSEGRAGAWPLPVMPELAEPPVNRNASPWITAAAGMAAGIGLALALSVIPSRGVTQTTAAALEPPRAVEPVKPTVISTVVTTTAVAAPALTTPRATPVVPPEADMPAAPPVTMTATPAPAPVERGDAAAPATKSTSAKLLPKKAAPAAKGNDVLKPIGGANAVQLGLVTDGPVGGHVSFWLEKPRRLVVDILGRRNGFAKTTYEIDHPLMTHMRIGQHKDKVRYVIDTAEDVSSQVKARVVGKTLLVEIRRK